MENIQLTDAEVKNLESYVFQELKKDYMGDTKNLNMPGLETILVMIASKVVIPIIVSLAGRLVYDKIDDWRKGKVKKEEILKQAIAKQSGNEQPVPRQLVVDEIVNDLLRDGISAEKARALAEKAYERLNVS